MGLQGRNDPNPSDLLSLINLQIQFVYLCSKHTSQLWLLNLEHLCKPKNREEWKALCLRIWARLEMPSWTSKERHRMSGRTRGQVWIHGQANRPIHRNLQQRFQAKLPVKNWDDLDKLLQGNRGSKVVVSKLQNLPKNCLAKWPRGYVVAHILSNDTDVKELTQNLDKQKGGKAKGQSIPHKKRLWLNNFQQRRNMIITSLIMKWT